MTFLANLVIYLLNRDDKEVSSTAIIIIVSVIGGIIGLPLTIFFIFHLYICITGRTTREVIKNIEKK